MRTLMLVLVSMAVAFAVVVGVYWWREGSLEAAGRQLDRDVAELDSGTKHLQHEVGDVGDAMGETVETAATKVGDTIEGDR